MCGWVFKMHEGAKFPLAVNEELGGGQIGGFGSYPPLLPGGGERQSENMAK